jgi:hypothetical protein
MGPFAFASRDLVKETRCLVNHFLAKEYNEMNVGSVAQVLQVD